MVILTHIALKLDGTVPGNKFLGENEYEQNVATSLAVSVSETGFFFFGQRMHTLGTTMGVMDTRWHAQNSGPPERICEQPW